MDRYAVSTSRPDARTEWYGMTGCGLAAMPKRDRSTVAGEGRVVV